jgi:uncharacterized protein YjdB
VYVGSAVQLTATPKDANGIPLSGRTVSWTTSNSAVATVSATGLVTGVAVGVATITATSEGQSGTAAVTVSNVGVASLVVTPTAANISVGGTVQLSATPKDAAGTVLTGRTVTWTTSTPAIATVSAAGLVTGIAAGPATITATSEGISASAAISVANVPVASVVVSPVTAVVLVGATVQLTATPKDASGNVLTGRSVTWASSAPAVATVSVTGLVTGVAASAVTITATSEGMTGSAAVTVNLVPVASVSLSPASAIIQVGQTVQLTATPLDANGVPLTGRPITWASSAPAVAPVGGGLVSGIATGLATITATSGGASGSAAITVNPAGGGGGATPWLVMDFAQYASTAALVGDGVAWGLARQASPSQIVLDQTLGYGSLKQSMRYDFPALGAVCQDYGIREGTLLLPGGVTAPELWVEVVARFSANFATYAGASGCNSDYKFIFGDVFPGGRYEIKSGTYGHPNYFSTNYPWGLQDTYTFTVPASWDGQWHTYRMHMKDSSTPGVTADAVWQVWFDGTKEVDVQNVVDGSTGIWGIEPGANMNQGPATPMQLWWGLIKIWNTNPGW